MFPLALRLISKAARCVGDHVGASNSAGSSDNAEESFILLNQVFRLDVSLAHPTCHSDAKTCPLAVKHVSKVAICQGDQVGTSNSGVRSDGAENRRGSGSWLS